MDDKLDEIIQNIKDEVIADQKGWQGSPYEAKQAIKSLFKETTLELMGEARVFTAEEIYGDNKTIWQHEQEVIRENTHGAQKLQNEMLTKLEEMTK